MTGIPPVLYQGSNDTAHHTQNNWINFPASMTSFINKIKPGHPMITKKLCKTHNEMRPCVEDVPDKNYTPFPLSALGRKLIGIDEWEIDPTNNAQYLFYSYKIKTSSVNFAFIVDSLKIETLRSRDVTNIWKQMSKTLWKKMWQMNFT